MTVDLDRVLALDAAATPVPWRIPEYVEPDSYVDVENDAVFLAREVYAPDAALIAFYRVAAPEMARTLLELRELASYEPVVPAGGTSLDELTALWSLRDAVLRVTAPPDEARLEYDRLPQPEKSMSDRDFLAPLIDDQPDEAEGSET